MRTQHLTRVVVLLSLSGLALAQASRTALPHTPDPRSNFWWQDFDGDELPDAFVVTPDGEGRLLRNRGDGTLADVTADAGLDGIALPRFSAWGDFDGDGAPDLFVGTHAGPSRLFHNQGNGTFVDIGAAAGLVHAGEDVHASWLDYDANGRPDLHVRTRTESLLYRNLGDLLFERVELGLVAAQEPSTTVPLATPHTEPGAAPPADAPASTETSGENGGRRPVLAPVRGGTDSAPDHAHLASPAAPGGDPGAGAPPGSADAVAIPTCALTLDDASGGGCLRASSVPQLGRLYPLSEDLFVEAGTGFVGLGTTTPSVRLEVAGQQVNHGNHSGALFKVDNTFEGPTRAYLGVEGATNFDNINSADWKDDEIGVAGISVGNGLGDNRGVIGHSNGIGVRGEYSGNPTVDFGELGRDGVGLRASGSDLAGEFLGDVELSGGAQLSMLNEDSQSMFSVGADSTGGAFMRLWNGGDPVNANTVLLYGSGIGGSGDLWLRSATNSLGVRLSSYDGGQIDLGDATGNVGLRLEGKDFSGTGSAMYMYNNAGLTTIDLDSDDSDAGKLELTNGISGTIPTVVLDGDGAEADDGGSITLRSSTGISSVYLKGDGRNGGGDFQLRNDQIRTTVLAQGDSGNATSDGGCFQLYENDGSTAADFCQSNYTLFDSSGSATINLNRQSGIITSALDTASYGQRQFYGVKASEVLLEDFGSGRLTNGAARVELDPIFLEAATVSEAHPLKVFVTLTGDCDGVYGVSVRKGATGFVVEELAGGKSTATFDYRVVAKRRGLEDTRLESAEMLVETHEHVSHAEDPGSLRD